MSHDLIQRLLNTEGKCIKLNMHLIKAVGLDAAIVYSYLVSKQTLANKGISSKTFNNINYFVCNVEEMQVETTLSAFKQRNALEILQKENLIHIRLGHARARFICVIEDYYNLQRIIYGIDESKNIDWNNLKYELFSFIDKQLHLLESTKKVSIDSSVYQDCLEYFVIKSELDSKLNSNNWKNIDIANISDNTKESMLK